MTCNTQDITINKGATFTQVVRWETPPLVSKAVTGVTNAAPAVVTAVGHGLTTGWLAAVVSAGGISDINAETFPPNSSDFSPVTVLTVDTVSLDDINSAEYSAYTSGGFLVYYTPVSLSGYTARMHIRETVGSSTTELELTSPSAGIVIDDAAKTITLTISAVDTAALDMTSGVYDLELVSGSGVVTRLLEGTVTITEEVTR